jgi:hypothetical protein
MNSTTTLLKQNYPAVYFINRTTRPSPLIESFGDISPRNKLQKHLRQDNSPTQFVFKIQITLKSGQELSNLLQEYNPNSLLNELPVRLFPNGQVQASHKEILRITKNRFGSGQKTMLEHISN